MTMTSYEPVASDSEERYNIKDGQRPITFTGVLVASADSQTGNDNRWTELTLYRTTPGGTYVLEKIGRSDVFHSRDCKRKSKGREYASLDNALDELDNDGETEPEDRFVPCEDCTPDFDVEPAFVEQDISSVATLPTATELIASLYHRDAGTSRFLSRVARSLLEKASIIDPDIAGILQQPSEIR